MSDLLVIIVGYIVINLLSLIIAARVRQYLAAFYAQFTHLFVIVLALYYGIDSITLQRPASIDAYLYLWPAIILTQMFFLFIARKKMMQLEHKKEKERGACT